jgi:catechol 2,3-dioxygenase-like lactoylglutathione lyase family enzyme
VITGIDHVQVAIPPGSEDAARAFYRDLLGMTELAKPAALAGRGGCWFVAGSAVLHLGVEAQFSPARKAHPAFLVTALDALFDLLTEHGHRGTRADGELPGVRRFHVADPLGNRIEFQQA